MTLTEILPLLFPQVGVVELREGVNTPGWVILTSEVEEQPLASVIVTPYIPAARFVTWFVVELLLIVVIAVGPLLQA
jgi:hypothetical protein